MASSPTVDTVKAKISAMNREKERLEKEIVIKNDDIEIELRKKESVSAFLVTVHYFYEHAIFVLRGCFYLENDSISFFP